MVWNERRGKKSSRTIIIVITEIETEYKKTMWYPMQFFIPTNPCQASSWAETSRQLCPWFINCVLYGMENSFDQLSQLCPFPASQTPQPTCWWRGQKSWKVLSKHCSAMTKLFLCYWHHSHPKSKLQLLGRELILSQLKPEQKYKSKSMAVRLWED